VLPAPTLGVFSSDYSPALRDYLYYEQLRRDFCKLPRARAGVLKGGIIWRLVWDSIGAPVEELVSDGPSEQVFTYGTSLRDPDSSDVLCDDELTEGEMNFICGVYTVFTGMLCIFLVTDIACFLINMQVSNSKSRISHGGHGKMLSIAQAFGPATGPVVVKTGFRDNMQPLFEKTNNVANLD
jgi:hypothetical protein